jgi:hypothetical protein
MIGTTRGFAAMGLAAALALSTFTGAQAAPESPQDDHPSKARLCARIPLLIERTEGIQRRLDGDETTRGSLARLTKRIDKAKERGNADFAAYLGNRLEIRRQRAEILPEQLALLNRAQATCDEAGS